MSSTSRVVAAAFAFAACAPPPAHPSGAAPTAPAAASLSGARGGTEARPRLVVAVVIDQVPSRALLRLAPLLDPNGTLRTAMATGAYYEAGDYPYAGTYTAPGHASIYTGVTPRVNGVVANEVWDPARSRVVSVVDDATHPVLGEPQEFASPAVVRTPTVADELERVTGGRALTVSLSLKDRGSVIPGGKHPDLVLFYDARRGAFTTSSYYTSALPPWLARFQTEHPLSGELSVWEPSDPVGYARLLGQDAAPGEGNWQGLGPTFPHDPRRSPEPLAAVRITPVATDYLFELARECVRELGMGTDEVPDLLMLSVSSVDYAGHTFGPDSWEYADSLVRADRALTRFLAGLRVEGGVRVLVTADHGAAPLVERSLAAGHLAFRVNPKRVVASVNAVLAGRFGLAAPPVASYTEPFVYLTDEAKRSPSYAAVLDAVAAEVEKTQGIAAVFEVPNVVRSRPETELDALVRASVADDTPADLFVVPSEYSVIDPSLPAGSGTSHGSPWTYDRHVPVLFFGPGVRARREAEPASMLHVAATIAELLGLPAPAGAEPAPLAGLDVAARPAR